MASWRRAFRLHLRGGTVEQDVEDEIAFHVEMRTQDLIEEGMAPHLAREEALRAFGDVERIRRQCRRIGHRRERGRGWTEAFSELWQDAAFALRQLRKTPVFTLIAVFTLALGVGATTAIFSLLHAVVLRPLPFPHPERIVHLWSIDRGDEHRSVSPGNFLTFQREAKSFERLAALTHSSFNLTGDGTPERLTGARVSAGYFEVFGAQPELGRVFGPEDDQPGKNPVVVLSSQLWSERFGGDPAVIGRPIRLNGQPHQVIGVMPASFNLRAPRLWVPMALGPEDATNYGHSYLQILGRLKPGVSVAAAQAEVSALAKGLETVEPESNQGKGANVEPYLERLLGGSRRLYTVLFGAVACVLLIACVNVANLLLARSAARSREIAIRAALGAGRGRIVRQLLTESLVLGLTGALAGIAVAWGGIRFLVAISPGSVPRLGEAGIGWPVLAFAVLAGLLSSVVFGLVPALRTARPDLQGMLKEGGRSFGLGAHRDRVRTGLMVAEVALALVLLVGAGLLIRSALRLQQVEIGFNPSGVLTARLTLPRADYHGTGQAVAALERVIGEVGRVGGVESAAAVSILPLARSNTSSSVQIDGQVLAPGEQQIEGNTRLVSPGYFKTLGIPFLRGRDFDGRDRDGAPRVVIVNQALARLAWPGKEAVGQRLSYWTDDADQPVWHEVVAVVGDIRQGDLVDEVRPEFYAPMAQANEDLWFGQDVSMAVVARTSGDPAALAPSVRQAVLRADPRLPAYDVMTMEEIRSAMTAQTRFSMMLLTALGAIGLALAAVGIYGVIAYFVSQRTQEIGLRMALGATETRVLGMVVRQALRPVLAGLALGVAGAAVATRVLAGLLYGVTATDPATFGGVLVVLAGAALLASYVPARRAARVDPTRALAP